MGKANPQLQDEICQSFGGPLLDRVEDRVEELAKMAGLTVQQSAGLVIATLFDRIIWPRV